VTGFLTDEQVRDYTGKLQPAAQVRVLNKHGIRHKVTDFNRVLVTWNAVNGIEDEPMPNAATEAARAPLLSLDALRVLPTDLHHVGSGVYFLWDQEWLVYVGQSNCIPDRIRAHRNARNGLRPGRVIHFDRHTYLLLESAGDMDTVEARYIHHYNPEFNVHCRSDT
jgi:hypothetical protein